MDEVKRIEIPIAEVVDDRELQLIGAIVHLLENSKPWANPDDPTGQLLSRPTAIEKYRIAQYLYERYVGRVVRPPDPPGGDHAPLQR